MKIYLAGKMGGRQGAAVLHERSRAKMACEEAGLEVYDPAESEYIDPAHEISTKMDWLSMKHFVSKDLRAIASADILLVLTGDDASEGTGWEMGYARYERHIPVVMVSPRRVAGGVMGFSNFLADAIFPNVETAVNFIGRHYAVR